MDPKAARLLRNDLRFRRFLGVGLSSRNPDRNTLWRYDAWASPAARDQCTKRELAEQSLGEVDRQLRARGLVMRRGRMVDGMRIRSAPSSNNRRKCGTAADADADGTRREKGEPTLGSKLHAAVDGDTGIVRRIALTPACCHDRRMAEAVVPEDVGDLWADAAHDAGALRERLEGRGITPVIAHNPRGRGLARWQRGMNFMVRCVRPRIEPVFGTLKRAYGLARARAFTLARNLVDATMKALAWNLRRAVTLLQHAT